MNKIIERISEIILKDIQKYEIDNWHGITMDNIEEYLISPRLETYLDSSNNDAPIKYWTVLEEYPKQQSGYTIYFDLDIDQFGLGTYNDRSTQIIALGIYGSFIDTLNAM